MIRHDLAARGDIGDFEKMNDCWESEGSGNGIWDDVTTQRQGRENGDAKRAPWSCVRFKTQTAKLSTEARAAAILKQLLPPPALYKATFQLALFPFFQFTVRNVGLQSGSRSVGYSDQSDQSQVASRHGNSPAMSPSELSFTQEHLKVLRKVCERQLLHTYFPQSTERYTAVQWNVPASLHQYVTPMQDFTGPLFSNLVLDSVKMAFSHINITSHFILLFLSGMYSMAKWQTPFDGYT